MQLRRSLLMMPTAVPGGLPAEYLAVQYLESTDTQYIDTGIPYVGNDTVEIEFVITDTRSDRIVFGAYYSGNFLAELNYLSNKFRLDLNESTAWSYSIGTKYKFKKTGSTWYVNDVEESAKGKNVNSRGSLYLFGRNNNARTDKLSRIRVYSYKHSRNNVELINLIPCIRISDSKPGMYDLVGRQFYTNSGTGEFDYLYPVGTNVYDGLLFQKNVTVDRTTGEVTSGDMAVSDFIQVSEAFEYTRSYRLYYVYNYDAQKNYLGYQNGVNNLGTSVINSFIQGTKFIRTMVHPNYVSADGLIYQDGCELVRTA